MGLLDDILGQALGKGTADRAVPQGNLTKPLMLALLALLASGALTRKSSTPATSPAAPTADSGSNPLGQILGGLLGGGASAPGGASNNPLGGLLGGGALAGGLLGGLGSLLNQFQQAGHGDTISSWVGTGSNRAMSPSQLGSALSPEVLEQLEAQTGLGQDEILGQLSQGLPGLVDKLTPQGRIPTESEIQDDDNSPLGELSRMSRM